MLQKDNEELQSAKDDYEIKLQELCSQMNKKATQPGSISKAPTVFCK